MIRKAVMADAKEIQLLIKHYADKEAMLFRTISEIYEHIRNFSVYQEGDKIVGAVSLNISLANMAEVRSLAVEPGHLKKGIGAKLVEAALKEAEFFGIKEVFTLTYVPDFFSKLGFKEVNKDMFPHKVWVDCVKCPKFPECNETAMLKKL